MMQVHDFVNVSWAIQNEDPYKHKKRR